MIKVAVHTAQRHTSLQPHLLYDGQENQLTEWLHNRGVAIIPCRSAFGEQIARFTLYYEEIQNQYLRRALHGVFLRMELPRMRKELRLDERVLYTDCDVLFRGEVASDLASNPCDYFAVAPEFDREDYRRMNTGVMLMNLPALAQVDDDLKSYVLEHFSQLQGKAWDQGAYRAFFSSDAGHRWNKLSPELNWKPYWGANPEARIIHFHGPKPFQVVDDTHFPELKHLVSGAYADLCSDWRDALREAQDEGP